MLNNVFESNASNTTDPATGADPLDDLTEKYNLNKYDARFRPKKKPVYVIQGDFLIDPVSGKTIKLEKLADSRIDPTDPAFELSAIDIAFIEEDYDAALRMAEKILEDDPENWDALFDKARALGNKGDHQASLDINNQLLARDPTNAGALYNKAWNLDALGDPKQALQYLHQSMEQDPNYIPAYGFEFRLLMNAGYVDDALEALEDGLNRDNGGALTSYQHQNLAKRIGCEDRESALAEIKRIREYRAQPAPSPTGMD